jgi:CRP-like cAMP-binding protein
MTSAVAAPKPIDDPMAHLPKSNAVEYRKGQVIYSALQPSDRVYLVTQGKVMVSRILNEDKQVVMDICQPSDIFGEGSLVNSTSHGEQAVALENTRVMSWAPAEIVDSVTRQTRLGMALLHVLAQRESELTWRMESLAVDTIHLRVARSLLRLASRLGVRQEDGTVHMPPLTHKMLSQYVGSTREIVTHHMTEFRKLGYLNYSRSGIVVNREAMQEWLQRNSPGRYSPIS